MSKFLRQDLYFWIGYDAIAVAGKADELVELLGTKTYKIITANDQQVMLQNSAADIYISCTTTSTLVRVPVKGEALEHDSDAERRELLTGIIERLMSASYMPQTYKTVTVSLPSIFLPVDEGTADGTKAIVHNFLEKMTHHTVTDIDATTMRITTGNKEVRYNAVSNAKSKQYAIGVEVERRFTEGHKLTATKVVDIARHTSIFSDLSREYETLMAIV